MLKYLLESIPTLSQVSGGLEFTEKPVIGVPCENELGNNYLLSTVNMPPGVPVATVGVNNGRNAAVLSGEILSLTILFF